MNKFSRCLTVFVAVICVAFMGVAALSTATYTDWKTIATKEYPRAEITKQAETIRGLEDDIKRAEDARVAALAAIAVDEKAISDPATGREVLLEQQLAQLQVQAHTLAEQFETEAKKAGAKLDELTLRREDTVRLQNQHDELVSQKLAAQAEVKRLRDLLFQARGVLERVERRRAALESQKGQYEEPAARAGTPGKT
jgi:chromosome segregation ATPase